ncbi:hypothetical protein [Rhodobacter capsulatus]|uniref:hypothetical protein n=1 Tax=Rhodobacter capsulatus TaxID=1061 RepID=UPI001F3E2262|nr:hypothetical protein [Rhodobacter capsulatus]
MGGLIGLGGAEFRLPVLITLFRFGALEAVILNKAMSLIVVATALPFLDMMKTRMVEIAAEEGGARRHLAGRGRAGEGSGPGTRGTILGSGRSASCRGQSLRPARCASSEIREGGYGGSGCGANRCAYR